MTTAPQGQQAAPSSPEGGAAHTWTLLLPYRTPPLSLNDRGHWATKARRVAEVRDAVGWLARAARVPALTGRPVVLLTYTPATARRRDRDNLVATLKPCVDALVAAGVLVDDDPEHVETPMPVITTPSRDLVGLRLTITADPYPGEVPSPT